MRKIFHICRHDSTDTLHVCVWREREIEIDRERDLLEKQKTGWRREAVCIIRLNLFNAVRMSRILWFQRLLHRKLLWIGASQNTVLKNFKILITWFSHMGQIPPVTMLLKFTKDWKICYPQFSWNLSLPVWYIRNLEYTGHERMNIIFKRKKKYP